MLVHVFKHTGGLCE